MRWCVNVCVLCEGWGGDTGSQTDTAREMKTFIYADISVHPTPGLY